MSIPVVTVSAEHRVVKADDPSLARRWGLSPVNAAHLSEICEDMGDGKLVLLTTSDQTYAFGVASFSMPYKLRNVKSIIVYDRTTGLIVYHEDIWEQRE